MGWFSDSLVDPTGLAGQYAGNLKGLAGQPDLGYAQVRAPVVKSTYDAAAQRYQDAIVNRQRNQAAESGWGVKSTQQGPAASRIARGFKDLETDRAMAELGQQNQWMNSMGQQIPSAINATQKTTPSIMGQVASPFMSSFGRELAPGMAGGLMKLGQQGFEGLRGTGQGVSQTPENTAWLGGDQGSQAANWGDWGGGANTGANMTGELADSGTGYSALADVFDSEYWQNLLGGF
jgi:hypothetical protein